MLCHNFLIGKGHAPWYTCTVCNVMSQLSDWKRVPFVHVYHTMVLEYHGTNGTTRYVRTVRTYVRYTCTVRTYYGTSGTGLGAHVCPFPIRKLWHNIVVRTYVCTYVCTGTTTFWSEVLGGYTAASWERERTQGVHVRCTLMSPRLSLLVCGPEAPRWNGTHVRT
jgi:hypothetical protein